MKDYLCQSYSCQFVRLSLSDYFARLSCLTIYVRLYIIYVSFIHASLNLVRLSISDWLCQNIYVSDFLCQTVFFILAMLTLYVKPSLSDYLCQSVYVRLSMIDYFCQTIYVNFIHDSHNSVKLFMSDCLCQTMSISMSDSLSQTIEQHDQRRFIV